MIDRRGERPLVAAGGLLLLVATITGCGDVPRDFYRTNYIWLLPAAGAALSLSVDLAPESCRCKPTEPAGKDQRQ